MSDKIKYDNYIHIPAFMIIDLHLKGNELLIYAIIFGFSQDHKSNFNGSLSYLQEFTNCSKQGVLNALESLVNKGLIKKTKIDNYSTYEVTDVRKCNEYGQKLKKDDNKKVDSDGQKSGLEDVKKVDSNGQKSGHNNNYILNNDNNIITTLSAQSSSEADSTSKSSSVNQSANSISLAEREELRKKDEEIKELRKIVESLKAEKESKPVKKARTRKTKTDEELQTLFSDFSESDIQITTDCINNFITVKQRNDPRFMRSRNQLDNWSYELLLFSKTQNRDLNEVATVWNWAINDHFWSSNINSVSAFTKKYESLIQKCNSRQNRGYQSRPKYNAIDFDNQNYNEIF